MRIEEITFRRDKNSELERGILINEGAGPILDMKGEIVKECWNYWKTYDYVMTLKEEKP